MELNVEHMKKIVCEIIKQEEEVWNMKINILPLTFIEYYKDVFNSKYNLIKRAIVPIKSDGVNIKGNPDNILIFLNRINKIEKIENKLFELVYLCYHESRHSIQRKLPYFQFERFIMDINHSLRTELDYTFTHDNYFYEIDANLYGVQKAKAYLKKYYPELYIKEKDRVENLEKKYQLDYQLYNATDVIDSLITRVRNNDKKTKNLNSISPILEIFLNRDGSFKDVKEIIKNSNFNKLDSKIIYLFFSSKSFLKQININELEKEELEIVITSLNFSNYLLKEQKVLEEKRLIIEKKELEEYITNNKHVLQQVKRIDSYYSKKILEYIKKVIHYNKQQEYILIVSKLLDESVELTQQKENALKEYNNEEILSSKNR